MKKLFLSIAVILSATTSTYAGGAVTGGSNIVWQTIQNATAIAQKGLEAMSAGANNITALQTTLLTGKEVLVKPIANSLLSSSLSQGANQVMSWARGGASGAAPLFVTNTQDYLDNIEKGYYQSAIASLAASGADQSLISALTDDYKAKKIPVAEVAKSSNLPLIIKNNLCNEHAISVRAQRDVSAQANSGEAGETNAYTLRKIQLYNEFGCNSAIITPEKEKKLLAAYKQDQSIGGLQALYAVTVDGDNDYSRKIAISQKTAEKATKATDQAEKKVASTGGVLAQSIFNKLMTDENGDACTEDCGDDPESGVDITPANIVKSQIESAANTGQDTALAAINSGDILTALLSTIGGFLSGGLVSNINISAKNNKGQTVAVVNTTPDLTPAERDKRVSAMNKQLDAHRDILNQLNVTSNNELALLRQYKRDLDSLNGCYQRLLANPSYQNDATTTSVGSYLSDRYGKVNPKIPIIEQEQPKIGPGINTINTTKSTINSTLVSDVIQKTFSAYQDATDTGAIPGMSSQVVRSGENEQMSATYQGDLVAIYPGLTDACNALLNKANQNTGSNPATIQQPQLTCTNGADNPYGAVGQTCNHCPDNSGLTWNDTTKRCDAPVQQYWEQT